MIQSQIPVTVLTGYLGAGKTTLLNRILTEAHGKRYAVIVNEFGEIGIDNDLVADADEEIFEMNNGCICCTVRGDLIRILDNLMGRAGDFDGILVETTGLADPAPVAQTFFLDDSVRAKTKLDAIVTVVDAKHFLGEIDSSEEAQEQIAFADLIIVNKTDLVEEDILGAVESRIRTMNPTARLRRSERCDVALDDVLGRDAFSLDRVLEIEPHFMEHTHHHHHDDHVMSLSLTVDRPLDPYRFLPWIQDLVAQFGNDILRLKGILSMKDDDQQFVIQGIHMLIEGDHQRDWRPDETRTSRLVLIGHDLPVDLIRTGFEDCGA